MCSWEHDCCLTAAGVGKNVAVLSLIKVYILHSADIGQQVFCDETRFDLVTNDNSLYIWRSLYIPTYGLKSRTAPTAGVMIRRAIASST